MKPIIPVYLNQSNVFDLLAMLKGGLATVTRVSETENDSSSNTASVSGGFGIGAAFSSLFKVDMSAQLEAGDLEQREVSSSEERIHTPASLLFQLIAELQNGDHLCDLSDKDISPGQIVQFECTLTKNPIVESFDSIVQILEVVETFQTPSGNNKGKGNRVSEEARLKKQILSISEAFKAGNTIDLVGEIETPVMRAMITLDVTYLSDPYMSNLVEGKFKVLGKVIRKISAEDEPLNLLRKSALSKTPEVLTAILEALNQIGEGGQFSIPDATPYIKGPAIHVLPIAIYV